MLKPQDLFVLLRLVLVDEQVGITFQTLSLELGMSSSEVHAAVKRARASSLIMSMGDGKMVNHTNLEEFVVHGVKYAFPPQRIGLTRGVPTSNSALPLSPFFVAAELPLVWPHPEGAVRGEGLLPLYRSVPDAALKNPELYELLALTDAIRAGAARERAMAKKLIAERLQR